MSQPHEDDGFAELEQMLASLFGASTAADAVAAMRGAGLDPQELTRMGAMPDLSQVSPGQMMALRAQMQQMFAATASGEGVNWNMGHDVALQVARAGSDPVITAAKASEVREALSIADLWLDAVTDIMPAPGQREAWARSDWAERTLPTWKEVCTPVAQAATQALSQVLTQQMTQLMGESNDSFGDEDGAVSADTDAATSSQAQRQVGALSGIVRSMAGAAFGLQLGHAIGELAAESISSTDVGLPLSRRPGTALVPAGIEAFAAGLDADVQEVRMFLAVREAATARLYAHVPWLRSQVLEALDAYAREIRIDLTALESAVAEVDPSDPEAIRQAMESGMFVPQTTQAQQQALEKLETLLALVEGWVEVVTARATAAHLPHAVALQEMVRRRRLAGGAAEQVFARLIGMEFRPRLVREAAQVWAALEAADGVEGRDALWRHPDVMPTSAELAHPEDVVTMRRVQAEMDTQIDADLASLLDGTLGYADSVGDSDGLHGTHESHPGEGPGSTKGEASEPGANRGDNQ